MKASKYAIAAGLFSAREESARLNFVPPPDDPKNNPSGMSFLWMKLTEALLIVPPFDRGLLVDVLATGMPL